MLIIKYILNIIQIAIVIKFSSFFLGIFWLVLCEYQEIVFDEQDYSQLSDGHQYTRRFLIEFDLINHDVTVFRRIIAVTYFAFTSLSTVGFGDFHPRSDAERLFCAFILLFGVAIFSLIMGSFTEILDDFQNFNKDIDDGDELSRFFGLLVKFNNKLPIDLALKLKIEAHFEYKWKNDKNMAIKDEMNLIDQIPEDTRIYLFRNFLFNEFLESFKKFFSIENKEHKR